MKALDKKEWLVWSFFFIIGLILFFGFNIKEGMIATGVSLGMGIRGLFIKSNYIPQKESTK